MDNKPSIGTIIRFSNGWEAEVTAYSERGFAYKGLPYSISPRLGLNMTSEGEIYTDTPEYKSGLCGFRVVKESNPKRRCSLALMPSDIKTSPISQLPYLGQLFDLVRAEAEEAGYTVEHWNHDDKDPRSHIHTLEVRPHNTLIVITEGGIVKKFY